MSDQTEPVTLRIEDERHVQIHVVHPDDRIILAVQHAEIPVETVAQMQQVLDDTFGPKRALVVVGDALTVLVQRMDHGHDKPASFTLHEPDGEQVDRHIDVSDITGG